MRFIRWLLRLLRPAPQWDVFKYHDGQRTRYADTLRLLARLDENRTWQELVPVITAARGDLANRARLLSKLADEVRAVFQLEEVRADHRGRLVGLPDLQCVHLLSRFIAFCSSGPDEYRPRLTRPMPPPTSPR
jgi:hypothetical protein